LQGLAFRKSSQAGQRLNSLLLSTTILVGTLHLVIPLSRIVDEGTAVASLVLAIVVL
jgi:hypothetical protein